MTYEYDNLRRIVKTSANVGAKEGIPTVHNEYTYDAKRGNLVEIRHNTDGNAANDVAYSFEQDALGRQTAVKVGNQTTGTLIHSATICCLQKSRFTASKPSIFAIASDEKFIRHLVTSFVWCYLNW